MYNYELQNVCNPILYGYSDTRKTIIICIHNFYVGPDGLPQHTLTHTGVDITFNLKFFFFK